MAGENYDTAGDDDLDKAVEQLDEELARRLSKQSKQSENVYIDPRKKFQKSSGASILDVSEGDDSTVISITIDAESIKNMIGSFSDLLGDADTTAVEGESGEKKKDSWFSLSSGADSDEEEDEERNSEIEAALEEFAAELEELLAE